MPEHRCSADRLDVRRVPADDELVAGPGQPDVQALVRDRVPELIRDAGRTPVSRILDDAAYRDALVDKLVEATHELRDASRKSVLEELADVYEVVPALAAYEGCGMTEVSGRAAAKRRERGGFAGRVYLESW